MVQQDMIAVRASEDFRMAVVASPAYFRAHPKPKHPRELHGHDCINYRRRSLGIVYRWEFTEQGKDFEVTVNGRILLNDGQLMIDAALDGLGLAYVPESACQEHLTSRALVRVLGDFCVPFPGFYLYYPSRAHVSPKLQALIDVVRLPRGRRKR